MQGYFGWVDPITGDILARIVPAQELAAHLRKQGLDPHWLPVVGGALIAACLRLGEMEHGTTVGPFDLHEEVQWMGPPLKGRKSMTLYEMMSSLDLWRFLCIPVSCRPPEVQPLPGGTSASALPSSAPQGAVL